METRSFSAAARQREPPGRLRPNTGNSNRLRLKSVLPSEECSYTVIGAIIVVHARRPSREKKTVNTDRRFTRVAFVIIELQRGG